MIKSIDLLAMTLMLSTCNSPSPSPADAMAIFNPIQDPKSLSQPPETLDLESFTYGGLLSVIRDPQDNKVQNKATLILTQRMGQDSYSELLLSPSDKVYTLGSVVPDLEDLAKMGDWVIVAKPSSRVFSQNINPYLKPDIENALVDYVAWLVTTPFLLSGAINDERTPYLSGTVYCQDPWTIFMGGTDGFVNINHQRFLLTFAHEIDHVERFANRTKKKDLSRIEREISAYNLALDQLDYSLELNLVDEIFAEDYRLRNGDKVARAEFLLSLDPAFGKLYPKERILPSQFLEGSIDQEVLKEQYLALYGEALTSEYQEELFWSLLYASTATEHPKVDAISLLCISYDDLEPNTLRYNALGDALTYLVPGNSAEDICSDASLINATVKGGELRVSHTYSDIPNGDLISDFPGLDKL
jgi:hypothetical protein